MKTKLEMAHEFMLAMIKAGCSDGPDLLDRAWQYTDAIQAEADKREKEEIEKQSAEFRNILNLSNSKPLEWQPDWEEWQPDWSQAPEWYNWWAMDENCKCHWFSKKPVLEEVAGEWFLENNGEGLNNTYSPTIHCGYKGDWRDSLRKRP